VPAPDAAAVTAIFTGDAVEALPAATAVATDAATALHGGPDAAVAFCRGLLLMCDIFFFSLIENVPTRQRGDKQRYSGATSRQSLRVRDGGASAARLLPRVCSPNRVQIVCRSSAYHFVS